MTRPTRRTLLALATLAAAPVARSQFTGFKKKKKVDPTRTVRGQVTDENEDGIRAVMQLRNLRTDEVKSFHTAETGEYHFEKLDLTIDYEITALSDGYQSKTRTVSSFETRTELIYNFKLKDES